MTTGYIDEAERASHVLALEQGETLASGPPAEVGTDLPGQIWDMSHRPTATARWRRGLRWRMWSRGEEMPDGAQPIEPDLTDRLTAATFAHVERAA